MGDEADSETDQRQAAINRRRLNQDEARTRFEPSLVDARDVDFSDRVGAQHRSYRTGNRRRRRRSQGGTEELGEWDDDEEEGVHVRLARLRREAEELKQQLEEAEHGEDGETQKNGELADGVHALSSMLDGLHATTKSSRTAEQKLLRSLSTVPPRTTQDGTTDSPLQSQSQPDPSSTLASATSLSDRLTFLETALGLSAPSTTTSTPPILPTLTSLSTQITTLTTTLLPTSPSLSASPHIHLDDLSNRLRILNKESEHLTTARRAATTAAIELTNARAAAAATNPHSHADTMAAEHKVGTATAAANAGLSLSILDDQTTKIRSLYQTLPTITSLHPILPTVLDRLRSLSAVHAGAAQAAGDLEDVVQRQHGMEEEIRKWREGLEKVEKKLGQVEGVMKGNVDVVGERLRGLEDRVGRLQ